VQEVINSYQEKLETSEASPYLIFPPVAKNDLIKIERERERGKIGRGVRMTHYVDGDILILKVGTKHAKKTPGCDSGRRTCFHFTMGGARIYISVHFGETLGGLGIAQV
jgi:hypothetical protein